MGCKLEYTIEDERTTLEENITPVPAVIFHHIMRFGFHP